MEPIRNILRHKKASVKFYEAECTKIDYEKRVVYAKDDSDVKGDTMSTEIPFDMLVVGVGAENATFGIPGVREHACFLKEVGDAQKIRKQIMDCVETATFKDQSPEEVKRLLHMVVVGGGPTGVEFAGELQDFFQEDLLKWVPQIKDDFHVTLVEALPNVLPMFSKQLIEYTESSFKEEHIDIRTKTMVKNVTDKYIEAEVNKPDGTKEIEKIPYGLLVWATGNALRSVVKDLMSQIPAQAKARRGLEVNEYLVVNGAENIWAVGDCAVANYAPTAQVAAQEGAFLARLFNTMAKTDAIEAELQELSAKQATANPDDRKVILAEISERQKQLRRVKQIGPFSYSHQGSLAYIGAEKAVADVSWFSGNIASGGTMTYLFWKSAYLSMCFSSKFLSHHFILCCRNQLHSHRPCSDMIDTNFLFHSEKSCPRSLRLGQSQILRPRRVARVKLSKYLPSITKPLPGNSACHLLCLMDLRWVRRAPSMMLAAISLYM